MFIKEAAKLAGISVRTLHHYDAIGLLSPTTTEAGYRVYSQDDLIRLQQILFFKELDFPLKQIGGLLNSPAFSRLDALQLQKDALLEKRKRLDAIIAMIDVTLKDEKGEIQMEDEQRFIGFDFSQNPYEDEAKRRWGAEAVEQTKMRTTALPDQKRWSLEQEMEGIFRKLAGLMKEGPDAAGTQEAVGEWHACLNRIGTYPLPAFKGLGELYVEDERFQKTMDSYAKGFAHFMKQAMATYAERKEER